MSGRASLRLSGLPAWVWILLGVLFFLRLPAIVQPLGPDQGIYAYVGEQILDGGLPYRDAWDQKPPGLHFAYAALWWLWPNEAVVPLADTVLAGLIAWLLLRIAPVFTAPRMAGPLGAALFLLLGNPAFARLGGVRVRGQGEVFIAALVTAGLWCVLRTIEDDASTGSGRRAGLAAAAGALIGLAALIKYPAAAYLGVVWVAIFLRAGRDSTDAWPARSAARLVMWSAAGLLLPVLSMLAVFGAGGALGDLWDATVVYNVRYSGETYTGFWSFARYLLTFPFQHARIDGLWLVGGAGSLMLLVRVFRRPLFLIPLAWTAVACLAIAINGSRGLPQYFLQAFPALALTAGIAGGDLLQGSSRFRRILVAVVVTLAVARVISFPQAVDATAWDLRRLAGVTDEATYLSRFEGRPGDKYSAPDVRELGAVLRARVEPGKRVFVFGFSAAAYLYAGRQSASRFFWNSPVITGFNSGRPGYAAEGLLADLSANQPPVIALQRGDGGRQGLDSAGWFLAQPPLATWLRDHYHLEQSLRRYDIWQRSASR
jgi:hypothetical protein